MTVSSPQTGEGGPDVGEVLTDQPVLHPGHGVWRAAQLGSLLTAQVWPEARDLIIQSLVNTEHWPEIQEVISPPHRPSLIRVSKHPRAPDNSGDDRCKYKVNRILGGPYPLFPYCPCLGRFLLRDRTLSTWPRFLLMLLWTCGQIKKTFHWFLNRMFSIYLSSCVRENVCEHGTRRWQLPANVGLMLTDT